MAKQPTITTVQDDLDKDTTFVLHGDTDLGTVLDEHGAIPGRGRYAAWSQKGATRRDGIVGFFNTKAEAIDAIVKAHGIEQTPAAEETLERCTPMMGGKVHTVMGGTLWNGKEAPPFPLCRTGASTNRGTKYRKTTAPLTCTTCLGYEERREAARAHQ